MADGKIEYKVGYDIKDASKSIDTLDSKIKSIGEKSGKLGDTLTKGLTMPILAGIGAATGAVIAFGNQLDETKKTAIGVNANVEAFQALTYASGKAGVQADKMKDTLKKVNEVAISNEETFFNLGVVTRDVNDEMLGSDEILMNLVKRMEYMDEGTRMAALQQLGMNESVETFNQILVNTQGFLGDYDKGLQNAVSSENISKFEKFNDTVSDIKDSLKNSVAEVALNYLPEMQNLADWFAEDGVDAIEKFIDKILEVTSENGDMILSLLGIAVVSGPILKVVGMVNQLATALGMTTIATTGLIGLISLSLIPWLSNLSETTSIAKDALSDFTEAWKDVKKNVLSGFDFSGLENYLDSVISKWKSAISGFKNANFGIEGSNGKIMTLTGNEKAAAAATYSNAASIMTNNVNIEVKSTLDGTNSAEVMDDIMTQWSQEMQLRGVIK